MRQLELIYIAKLIRNKAKKNLVEMDTRIRIGNMAHCSVGHGGKMWIKEWPGDYTGTDRKTK